MDEGAQTVCSRREEARMHVHLATPGGFRFAQTDEWSVAPWAGFPTLNRPEPPRQWDFTATTRERAARRRIAAVMAVDAEAEVRAGPEADSVRVSARLDGAAVHFMIHLQPGATPAIEGELRPPTGPPDPIRGP